jgi:hypothetical protein
MSIISTNCVLNIQKLISNINVGSKHVINVGSKHVQNLKYFSGTQVLYFHRSEKINKTPDTEYHIPRPSKYSRSLNITFYTHSPREKF